EEKSSAITRKMTLIATFAIFRTNQMTKTATRIPMSSWRPGMSGVAGQCNSVLEKEAHRLLDILPQRAQKFRPRGAVDDAVVARHRHFHAVAHDDLPIDDDRPRFRRTDGEDGHVRRIDDGGELFDAPRAEVRDRDGRALVLVRHQLAVFLLLGDRADIL